MTYITSNLKSLYVKENRKKGKFFSNRIDNVISIYIGYITYTIIGSHFEYCATLLIDIGKTITE
jgi:sugar phosphate permease